MARYGNFDYAYLAKTGFLLGLALFAIGGGGGLLGHAFFEPLPAWESTLFLDLEVLGVLVGFVSPFLFGVFLPLTE